jgi:hypothetical protein
MKSKIIATKHWLAVPFVTLIFLSCAKSSSSTNQTQQSQATIQQGQWEFDSSLHCKTATHSWRQTYNNYGASMSAFYRACQYVEFHPDELNRESAALLFATFRIQQLLAPKASKEELAELRKTTPSASIYFRNCTKALLWRRCPRTWSLVACLEKVRARSKIEEEGFCELLAFRYYDEDDSLEARYHAEVIRDNKDKIYGDGFRFLYRLSNDHGFFPLVNAIRGARRIPRSAFI